MAVAQERFTLMNLKDATLPQLTGFECGNAPVDLSIVSASGQSFESALEDLLQEIQSSAKGRLPRLQPFDFPEDVWPATEQSLRHTQTLSPRAEPRVAQRQRHAPPQLRLITSELETVVAAPHSSAVERVAHPQTPHSDTPSQRPQTSKRRTPERLKALLTATRQRDEVAMLTRRSEQAWRVLDEMVAPLDALADLQSRPSESSAHQEESTSATGDLNLLAPQQSATHRLGAWLGHLNAPANSTRDSSVQGAKRDTHFNSSTPVYPNGRLADQGGDIDALLDKMDALFDDKRTERRRSVLKQKSHASEESATPGIAQTPPPSVETVSPQPYRTPEEAELRYLAVEVAPFEAVFVAARAEAASPAIVADDLDQKGHDSTTDDSADLKPDTARSEVLKTTQAAQSAAPEIDPLVERHDLNAPTWLPWRFALGGMGLALQRMAEGSINWYLGVLDEMSALRMDYGVLQGKRALAQQRHEEALTWLLGAAQRGDLAAEGWVMTAKCQLQLRQTEPAILALQRAAVRITLSEMSLVLELTILLCDQEQASVALKLVTRLTTQSKTRRPVLCYCRALALHAEGRERAAKRAWRKACALFPHHPARVVLAARFTGHKPSLREVEPAIDATLEEGRTRTPSTVRRRVDILDDLRVDEI
ncbi:hypothetical protein [Magnetofaba australis]|uniref:Uncharacterized protein n=1 Tax=Magnetofaba australis IT-1 TaxID=1434232 RepID=W0LJB4_9PROT|nr:hypothetical protein [Magnetofaba australis]AHG23881.1 hypothetical protein MIIT1_02781 [Magnetofaba australis IT-1]OSM08628.1 hypothetical protein MAIT1_02781 [Magnetofaba australis IT-1]